ncbi:Uncharacterised protein [uncultured archaeon]|nr:Uncharacterised protein [uncultured archaeon]
MNKAIILVFAVLAVCAMLFSGCVIPSAGGGTNITSDKDAAKTVADISTDIFGITNSLNEIDKSLTDQNSP